VLFIQTWNPIEKKDWNTCNSWISQLEKWIQYLLNITYSISMWSFHCKQFSIGEWRLNNSVWILANPLIMASAQILTTLKNIRKQAIIWIWQNMQRHKWKLTFEKKTSKSRSRNFFGIFPTKIFKSTYTSNTTRSFSSLVLLIRVKESKKNIPFFSLLPLRI
jgi:hypothetical protein